MREGGGFAAFLERRGRGTQPPLDKKSPPVSLAQVITHVKEKLQFLERENASLEHGLASLDTQLAAKREVLQELKTDRQKVREREGLPACLCRSPPATSPPTPFLSLSLSC